MRGRLWAGVVAVSAALVLLAGCVGTDPDLEEASTQAPDATEPVEKLLEVHQDDGAHLAAPVDVVLVGFEPGTGEALAGTLDKETVRHNTINYPRSFPPGQQGDRDREPLAPLTAEARYDVHQLEPAVAERFFDVLADHQVDADGNVYDANAAEDVLATLLPDQGIELDTDAPTLVLLHADGRLGEDHAWRFTYPNGHLEPVRAFGERAPILAYDVSATPDPYVVDREPMLEELAPAGIDVPFQGSYEPAAYNYRMDPGGNETVDLLDELARDATHHRLLKGPIYPSPLADCHDVNVLIAVHQTALTELAPAYRDAEDWIDEADLEAAFENATGDPVQVHAKAVTLPQDDPVLDATTRRAGGAAGYQVFLDTMRWYLDENWDTYAETREGCEAYLSMVLFADASSSVGNAFGGIGMYDVKSDRRISFSVSTDFYRAFQDPEGPLAEDGETMPNFPEYVVSHETGHLIALHHPQHGTDAEEGFRYTPAFESVWSPMSYQNGDALVDYGALDRSQFERNRAGYALEAAQELDLEGTEAYEEALDRVGDRDFEEAFETLDPLIQEHREDGGAGDAALPGPVQGDHWHPR